MKLPEGVTGFSSVENRCQPSNDWPDKEAKSILNKTKHVEYLCFLEMCLNRNTCKWVAQGSQINTVGCTVYYCGKLFTL